ncbi:MAG TPA: MFS transporter [Streptosporangiaceae bacterium]|nr:MFS transporter [Streptosporangiaceae bacterium]
MSADDGKPASSPWRDRRFLVFATGNFINNIGEQAFQVTLPLLAYALTRSLLIMSLLVLVNNATLVLAPLLGAIVDRFGARTLVVPGLLVQLVAAVLLNVLALARHAPFFLVFIFCALVALGGETYRAGWMVGVVTMFPDNPIRSRGSLNTLFVLAKIAGPMLVAVALGPIGYLGLLWLNVGTFVAPIIVWLIGIHPPRQESPPKGQPRPGLHRDIIEGWRLIRQQPAVLHTQMITLPLHFVASTATVTLAIFYLRGQWHLSAQQVSTVMIAINISALVGVLLVAERRRLRVRRTLAITAIGMTGLLFAMAAPRLWVFLAALVVFYALRQAMATAALLMIFSYFPGRAIGRASGTLDLLSGIPDITAPLAIPFLVPAFGVENTFVVLGVVALISVGWLAFSWRSWKERVTPPPASPPGLPEALPAVLAGHDVA